MIKCSAHLVVQQYGGGTRYHCPNCDVRMFGGMLTAYWTNGPVPASRQCENKKNPPKGSKVFNGTLSKL